ncbi:MAG: TonB-dependent receptor [Sphingomonas bacterium]|uniref:TonB-dependent receptor domain-containing protein n=1 Tax=Sphingomonas bacterium TaxID=1895847 RepID=UPI0026153AFB|nr:TonB-dependent receptor [Sphingomonas bacterium]MDB5707650.1 TonB-dependent receptor [Sphingomonas bacterium]
MKSVRRLGLSVSAIPFVMLATASAAFAQAVPATPSPAQAVADTSDDTPAQEDIVVTGSSLKGVAPVGSNLVTVGRAQLEQTAPQTVQQILKTVPAVVGLQSAGQGSYGSFDGASTNAPTIHGLGASASNSTLILINGHRFPLGGLNHALADPNILAPLALERVEVLADGASSVYGSDAVAGVINFITRRKYDGIEATAQKGFGNDYDTFTAGILAGKSWDSGSVLASYNYTNRSNLLAGDRSFTHLDHTSQGGTNQANYACSPASITAGGLVYYSPYNAAAGLPNNTAANGVCDFSGLTDLLPAEKRHNAMATIRQDIGDKFTATVDVVYSDRKNHQQVQRGSASATIFGPGYANAAQINPFFTVPTALAATPPTSETVNFDADQLFGPGAFIDSSSEDFYVAADGEYRVTDTWRLNFGVVAGSDKSRQFNSGQLNGSAFNLAVNGTTNGGGSTTQISIPGTTTVVLNTPLTTANAFDPFQVTNNRSSAATLAKLIDNNQVLMARQTMLNFYGKVDGQLFDLPGGPVRAALGGEYIRYTLTQDFTRPNNTGATSQGSTLTHLDYFRDVKSAYIEMLFPLIGPETGIPGIRRFDVNLSGRYDDYSDFGHTSNPKIAANWEIVEGVKVRGNWAKSFVAPALTSRGVNIQGVTGESSFAGATGASIPGGNFSISTTQYPGFIGAPGCPAGSTTCLLGSGVTGILLAGGNGTLKPQKGKAWSVGLDLTPTFMPGFRLSVTYWNNQLRGGITSPIAPLAVGATDLNGLLTFYPGGASAAQIAAATGGLPQTGSLNAVTYFIYDYRQRNVLNLDVAGLDVAVNYHLQTGSAGTFDFGGGFTRKLKFDQFFGSNGTKFSVLGTAGFNTTFPSVKFEGRANLGWELGGFNANVYLNYLGSYTNWGGPKNPVVRTNGIPSGGGDPVKANTTVDLNLSYKLRDMAFLKEAQLFVDATNVFDRDPPFYNAAAGYDNINASPIGRVVTIGIRTKF